MTMALSPETLDLISSGSKLTRSQRRENEGVRKSIRRRTLLRRYKRLDELDVPTRRQIVERYDSATTDGLDPAQKAELAHLIGRIRGEVNRGSRWVSVAGNVLYGWIMAVAYPMLALAFAMIIDGVASSNDGPEGYTPTGVALFGAVAICGLAFVVSHSFGRVLDARISIAFRAHAQALLTLCEASPRVEEAPGWLR